MGSGNYEVKQGDCIESIAFEHGFSRQFLCEHANKATLVVLSGLKPASSLNRKKPNQLPEFLLAELDGHNVIQKWKQIF